MKNKLQQLTFIWTSNYSLLYFYGPEKKKSEHIDLMATKFTALCQ